jgi:hypothetical protein
MQTTRHALYVYQPNNGQVDTTAITARGKNQHITYRSLSEQDQSRRHTKTGPTGRDAAKGKANSVSVAQYHSTGNRHMS